MNERRAIRASEVRAPDDGTRMFEAVVVNYGVLDDYETIFDAGCFAASLETRLPRITWAHDWSEPLGRYVDYKDTDESLTLVGEFDDFDAVPRARQAMAQLRSGTIDQFSVGFVREEVTQGEDEIVHFTKARLDEAALVLAGAVPGTKLIGIRSQRGGIEVVRQVPEELVLDLGGKIAAGEMTKAEALATLDLAAGETPPAPVTIPEDDGTIGQADDLLDTFGLA